MRFSRSRAAERFPGPHELAGDPCGGDEKQREQQLADEGFDPMPVYTPPDPVPKGFYRLNYGRMPAHKDFLGEAKVHLLAAYVYSLSTGQEGMEE